MIPMPDNNTSSVQAPRVLKHDQSRHLQPQLETTRNPQAEFKRSETPPPRYEIVWLRIFCGDLESEKLRRGDLLCSKGAAAFELVSGSPFPAQLATVHRSKLSTTSRFRVQGKLSTTRNPPERYMKCRCAPKPANPCMAA